MAQWIWGGGMHSGANQLQAALSAGLGCVSEMQGPESHCNGTCTTALASLCTKYTAAMGYLANYY